MSLKAQFKWRAGRAKDAVVNYFDSMGATQALEAATRTGAPVDADEVLSSSRARNAARNAARQASKPVQP